MVQDDEIIEVQTPLRRYKVVINPGLLDRSAEFIWQVAPSRKLCVITDSNVAPLYLQAFTTVARQKYEVLTHILPAGEKNKTVEALSSIYDSFLPAGIDRSTPVVALGGGVVGDVAGFAAATMLRGLPFVQIPTSLLAMVDASVGGKTGIDHPAGKNLVGAFHHPWIVLTDPQLCSTLPPREMRSGLAECVKHAMIHDNILFQEMEQTLFPTSFVARNVRIKAAIAARDPTEQGERALLNFGHTFGHAIEVATDFSVSHGEAVSIGMVAACHAARMLSMFQAEELLRVEQLLRKAELPVRLPTRIDESRLLDLMSRDKKVKDGRIRLVLPERIGHAVVRADVPVDTIRDALRFIQG